VVASLGAVAHGVRLVEARAGKDAADHLAAGHGLHDFVEVALPTALDGAALLHEVEQFIHRYVVLPSDAAYVAMTLWVAHTHAIDAFESTPRLAFLSPEPECGKTRALEVLELVVQAPMHEVDATPAAIFRVVGDLESRLTLLFDEIDTIFGPRARENEDLRRLLNAGHRRSGLVYRCVGEGTRQQVKQFPAYAAVALAGIGNLPNTLLSRSVVIPMQRRSRGERVASFRRREAEAAGAPPREKLASWAAAHRGALEAVPAMPDSLADRAADCWEPLLAVADAAGGVWPQRARTAAVTLGAKRAEGEPSLGIRLLADIRAVFESTGLAAMSTATLLKQLHAMEEAPWGSLSGRPLDARGLARWLTDYGIHSKTIRVGGSTPRGYERAAFEDAWARYLPPLPSLPPAEGTPSPSQNSATSETFATEAGATPATVVTVV
jgi:hypothetical protein